MSSLQINLATRTDNTGLCEILRDFPMPGNIHVAYTRDPSFFDAAEVHGIHNDIIVVKNGSGISGFGLRSVKTVYLNGVPTPVGYLSNLRTTSHYQGPVELAKGYRFLHKLHEDNRTRFYLSTILEENEHARKVLTSGRLGLPNYDDYGLFYCAAISFRHHPGHRLPAPLTIRPAVQDDLAIVTEFLNQEGRKKQFFPVYTAADIRMGHGLLRNLEPGNILLAFSDEHELIGTSAIWDQNPFRQSRINGYGKWLRLLRHPYNAVARLTGYPVLPRAGTNLNTASLALCCVKENNPETFKALLSEIIRRYRWKYRILTAGFHGRDPLLNVIRNYHHIPYRTRLYTVFWDDGRDQVSELNHDFIPYLELGSL